MSVLTLGNRVVPVTNLSSNSSPALYNLFDYLLPTYFENTERINVNNATGTHWVVETIDRDNKFITVNKSLPVEMLNCGTDLTNQWFVYRTESCWLQVVSVDSVQRKIYYDKSEGASIEVGVEVYFLCPFRSAYPSPLNMIVGIQTWANLWIIPGPSWKHSDGTYRMVGVGYTTGASPNHNTLTLFSSSDLETWTAVGDDYKYKAGEAPFNESWCVGNVTLQTYGCPLLITNGEYAGYYANIFGGLDSSGFYNIAIVIFDEDFNIIYMPSSSLTVAGYEVDSSSKYLVGLGLFYRNSKIYAFASYRDFTSAPYVYKLLTFELSDVVNPVVSNIKVVLPSVIPDCWMSLSAPGGSVLEYKNRLYFFVVGENQTGYTKNTPLNANFECGVIYEHGDGYEVHKQSPFIFNAINCSEVFEWSSDMSDSLGTFGSILREGDTLNMFIAAKNGYNSYRIWRYVLNLPE